MSLKIAVISTVFNETLLLPQFLGYYAPQVDGIFLIDNESTDGSLDDARRHPKVEVSTLDTGGEFNTRALCEARLNKKSECIGLFDYVLIVDADEFVVPKCGNGLREELESLWPTPILGTHGFAMWKHPEEHQYNPDLPLLEQRKWGIEEVKYSKPIIVRPELEVPYRMGFHDTMTPNNHLLKNSCISAFYLLHYVGVEKSEYLRRSMERTLRLSKENLESEEKWGHQYHDGTEEKYREVFDENCMSESLVRIRLWKGAHG